MTVCVAAISVWIDEDGKGHPVIVLAADRMITARMIREYEFADQTKAVYHRDNVMVLMSGSIDALFEAYNDVAVRVGRDCTVKALVEGLTEEIQSVRRRKVERNYLERYGLSMDDFVGRQKEWTPDFFERLDSRIADPENDLGEVIVAGFDSGDYAMPMIYTIEGPGWERSWNGTGFCAIGIGAEHAEAEFTQAMYTPRTNWLAALRIVGFAKRRAEAAPGVGFSTDMWYIMRTGLFYLEPSSVVVETIGKMFSDRRMAEIEAIGEDAAKLDEVLQELTNASQPRPATAEERQKAEAAAEEQDQRLIYEGPPISSSVEESASEDQTSSLT